MINPILSFIENTKLINQEKETKTLDEHARFMLAIEAMKADVYGNKLQKIANAIDDQHIVGGIDVKLSGELSNHIYGDSE